MGNCFINRTPTGIVDQSFNAFSTNAQSGIAVQEAINTIAVDTTYDPLSANAQSGVAVKQAIDALDVTTSGAGTNKTLTALSQADGKISATFNNISITKSQVSDFAHVHGNIANNGTLSANVAIANGDRLVIRDVSDSNKITSSNTTFGTSTSTYLRNDGAWGTPTNTDTKSINTASILTTISASELADTSRTWTATADCWVVFSNYDYDGNMSHGFGYLYIDNVELCDQTCDRFAVIAKKNSAIKVRRYSSGRNNFDVKCYAVK